MKEKGPSSLEMEKGGGRYLFCNAVRSQNLGSPVIWA